MSESAPGTPGLPPSDRPLRCRSGLVARFCSDGGCELDTPRGRLRVGPQGLPVLGAFALPRTAAEATTLLSQQLPGPQSAFELLATIVDLYRHGALELADERSEFSPLAGDDDFGAAPLHIAMLGDAVRTEAWLQAVHELVRPGDVVIDLGTGTGILAIAAALAGARRVYALEVTGAAAIAEAMARDNGVQDRVRVVRGWSTELELPERADVLVCEIFGDDPFGERVLESTFDAVQRLLKSDARMIPSAVTLFAVPVEVPTGDLERLAVTPALLASWSERYGFDFSALGRVSTAGNITRLKPSQARTWRRLGPPISVIRVEFGGEPLRLIDRIVELPVNQAGDFRGVLLFFEAELGRDLSVSTDPELPGSASHWCNPALVVPSPRPVKPGVRLRLRYRYPAAPSMELLE